MKYSDMAAIRAKFGNYNAGFIVVKPTNVNRRIYTVRQSLSRKFPRMTDQVLLNIAIRRGVRRATFLNKRIYVDGMQYFVSMKRLLPRNNDPCSAVNKTKCSVLVVHNNYILTKQAKIYRFREHFMWSYDGEDRYYTSQSRKYIMFTNPAPTSRNISLLHLRNRQLGSFRTALVLGYLLDRVVILPRFYCGTNATPCPLHSYIHIATLDIFFEGKYRESTFLQHPKVPNTVKHNASYIPIISYATRLSSLNDSSTINSNNVVKLFHQKKDKLINVGILEGMQVSFSDNYTESMLNQKLQKALRLSDYRQYIRYGHFWP